jgi:hypothetical protein
MGRVGVLLFDNLMYSVFLKPKVLVLSLSFLTSTLKILCAHNFTY